LLKPEGVGKPLRIIEAEIGKIVSRSALSRHLNNCLFMQKLNRFRDRRGAKGATRYNRIIVKDTTTDASPKYYSFNPWDEQDSGPQPFRGRIVKSDLFLVIQEDALTPDARSRMLQRAALDSHMRSNVKIQNEDVPDSEE
jgi:hypothetical protein